MGKLIPVLFIFYFCSSFAYANSDCESVKNSQQRLACFDSKSRKDVKNAKVEKTCHSFEIASNTLKISVEGGISRSDMLASGIAELVAKREECRMANESSVANPSYERNTNGFQDILRVFQVTESICRMGRVRELIQNCTVNLIPLTTAMEYGCKEYFRPIPRHAEWIQQHCEIRYKAADLISHIMGQELTAY